MAGIPGYTGYIPHKQPEQVFSCSFGKAYTYAVNHLPTITTARIQRPIPGYRGFVPGKVAESFFEERFEKIWSRSIAVRQDQASTVSSARNLQRQLYLQYINKKYNVLRFYLYTINGCLSGRGIQTAAPI